MVSPLSATLIRAYSLFQKGFLPFPGAVLEQPALVMDAFDVIDWAISRGNADRKISNKRNR